MGGGANGFDFSKVKNNGVIPQSNNASLSLGTGNDDWGCTYDNTTGLMWEVKTATGFRYFDQNYSWYSTNVAINGGGAGTANGGNCTATGRCDTEKFVQDVNATNMCGHGDWRMPTFRELQSLVRLGVSPPIDGSYFPSTVGSAFWSGSPVAASANNAWSLFANGASANYFKSDSLPVRLVRVGR